MSARSTKSALPRILLTSFISTIIAFLPQTGFSEVDSLGLRELKNIISEKQGQISFHRKTRLVNFMGVPKTSAITVSGIGADKSITENARLNLNNFGATFGIQDVNRELTLEKSFTKSDGRSTVRFQQIFNGVPVIAGELLVNQDSQGALLSINGEISPKLNLSVEPRTAPQAAAQKALEAVAKWHKVAPNSLQTSVPVLSIYDPRLMSSFDSGRITLVWRVDVSSISQDPIREFVLVDAQLGNLVLHFNQMHSAKDRRTFDSNSTSSLPGTQVCNEASDNDACTGGTIPEADDAHRFAGDFYDFFFNTHGRDSLDDAGMRLISSVRYCPSPANCPYQNAYWDGTQMVYGEGLAVDDVVAHELTHGFTEFTSNLFYYQQSGAISESFSDVWGEFVDLTNDPDLPSERWLLGEDSIFGALRDMSDPTVFGDPDRMTSANYFIGTWFNDSGGVHANSGINNKAVFLLVDGGSFNGQTVNALGITKVAHIYYETQTSLLTSASDYLDLYNALYQACQNLVGTNGIVVGDCTDVRAATDAVEMNLEPAVDFNPEAEMCVPDRTQHVAFSEDFEGGGGGGFLGGGGVLKKWILNNGENNSVSWQLWSDFGLGPYATSGQESLFAWDAYVATDLTATTKNNIRVPNGEPYLHFKHAFDFQPGSFDGAVLEYSTNDGDTWFDAAALFDAGQLYKGTIGSGSGNPLAGRAGFVNNSHGWVSTRLDLSSLAGQDVKFRWRAGTNSTLDWIGWWLDDVQVYSCNTPPAAPALVSPTDSATAVDSASVTFDWDEATDIDGDRVTYELQVCLNALMDSGCIAPVLVTAIKSNTMWAGIGGSGLIFLGLMGLAQRRRRLVQLAALFLVLSFLSSCGGGGGGGGGGKKSAPTTIDVPGLSPATTYFWKVSADDGSGGITDSVVWSFTTAP